MPKSPLRVVVDSTKTPQWRAIPTEDRLMPPPTIHHHHHHRSASPISSGGRERVKDAPKPTLAVPSIPPLPRASNPPTRASSPSSTSSSVVLGGTNGVSYVEVSSPSSAARGSLRPPRSSGAGGKSDRTHSQKGGSATSSKDQVLLDAAEQARIAAAIPQAQITTGSTKQAKKGFARRLFSSIKL